MKNNIFLILLSITFLSCKFGLKATPENIVGKWNIIEAKRNGQATKTLESAYFEFNDNHQVTSNILQSAGPSHFELEDDVLIINDLQPVSFNITEFNQDTMSVNGVFGNYQLELLLAK
jgi:hypothetical protein